MQEVYKQYTKVLLEKIKSINKKIMETFYTSDEVAKMLKINRQTILRFIRENKIGAIKIGREYRIKQSDLELYTGGNLHPEKEVV